MKVYIIEVGCYSDRHVMAVATTLERAEEILEIARNYKHLVGPFKNQPVMKYELEDAGITEYELDKVPLFLQQRIYDMSYNPGKKAEYQWSGQLRDHEKDYAPPFLVRPEGITEVYAYSIAIPAKDYDSALKIANEHIMQYIAKQPIKGDHTWTWAEVKPILRNTPEEIATFENTYKGLPENSVIKTTNSQDIEAFEILDNRGIRPIMRPQRFLNVEELK